MRDGTTLASDVYRPPERRHPTILMRTPYDRTALGERARELNLRSAVERDYAVVIQDVRGRYASGGEFRMLMSDVEDGADTIRWIRCQPWSDGRVVMIGNSYNGCVQFAAARSRPAGLIAIAPTVSGALRTIWHEGETVKLAGLDSWLIARLREQRARVEDSAATAIDQLLAADPVSRYHALLDRESSAWALGEAVRHVLSGRAGDDFWGAAVALPAEPLPAIHASGWYDSCLTASVEAFEGWQAAGAAPQQLLVGPWGHELSTVHYPSLGLTGSNTPPPGAVQDAQMDFFDAVLGRGSRPASGCVTTWVLGANRWQHGDVWPPPSTCAVPIMLGGDAAPALSPDAGERGLVQFAYDPADPVPTLGGVQESTGHLGPADQTAIERRPDVITATSGALERPIELAGWPLASLCVASSAPATSFVVRLALVTAEGSFNLTQGYWSGALENGEEISEAVGFRRIAIRLSPLHAMFAEGTRVRVHLTSSDYPAVYPAPNVRWDPADGPPLSSAVAQQRVRLDCSWVELPFVRSDGARLPAFAIG
jgi:putative CocE/NonD family hydrolase